MIKIEHAQVFNFEGALRGLRNPKKSHRLSDSRFGVCEDPWYDVDLDEARASYLANIDPESDKYDEECDRITDWLLEQGISCTPSADHCVVYNFIGKKDLDLAQRMVLAGADERKFMRQIFVTMDITAPLFLWREMSTYKIGTTANSESTMHTIEKENFDDEQFGFSPESYELHVFEQNGEIISGQDLIDSTLETCELLRAKYVETKDKRYWRMLIELLPSAWLQKRTWTANYEVLRNIYLARRNHKLQEWRDFCKFIETLPYAKEFICIEKPIKIAYKDKWMLIHELTDPILSQEDRKQAKEAINAILQKFTVYNTTGGNTNEIT